VTTDVKPTLNNGNETDKESEMKTASLNFYSTHSTCTALVLRLQYQYTKV